MSLKKKFQKSLDKQWCLRFKTVHPDGDCIDGVVTQIKREFIALREEEDFAFDGVVVLPKRVIKGYRDGKYDRCCNEILRENGAMSKCHSPDWLSQLKTVPEVVAELCKRDIWPAVETIYKKGTKTAYYIGPITATAEDRFFLRYFDAAGRWDREYEIIYSEVFKIEFDSNYANRFNQYMRNRILESPAMTRARREFGNGDS